jgi:CRISPR system Cascade subunit CasB
MDSRGYLPVVERWWQSIFLSERELKEKNLLRAPTSFKAQLKRCQSADEAMLLEGFRALWASLLEHGLNEELEHISPVKQSHILEAWATVAVILVHIKQDNNEKLAVQAGKKQDKQGHASDKSIVSELRFAKLQNAVTPNDFLTRMRRMVQQLEGKVSPTKVAADILQWFDEFYAFQPRKADKRISVQWAMDYYRSASVKTKKSSNMTK